MAIFDRSRIVNVSQHDLDELTCGICQDILVSPVVLICCRQTYCRECIEKWLKGHNNCPNDRQPLDYNGLSNVPRALINILDNLRVYCDYRKYGCKEELKRSEFERHLKRCPFNTCENCETRKVFGTEHNCLQVFKTRINDKNQKNQKLNEENQRLVEKIQLLVETNSQLSEKNNESKQKFESKCNELKNKEKTFTEIQKSLAEQNIGLKKEIEILKNKDRENKNMFHTNSRLNSDLNVAQNNILSLKIELDEIYSEYVNLESVLDISNSKIEETNNNKQKLNKIIGLPFLYVFILLNHLCGFARDLCKLLLDQVLWLNDYLFRRPEILWALTRSGRKRHLVGRTVPGVWWRLFPTEAKDVIIMPPDELAETRNRFLPNNYRSFRHRHRPTKTVIN